MSASMIRKGLELLSDDVKPKDVQMDRKTKQTKKRLARGTEDGVMGRISLYRHGAAPKALRPHQLLEQKRHQATVKDMPTVEEFRKKSRLSKNLCYFLGSEHKAQHCDTEKIQIQSRGRQSRHRPDLSARKQQEEHSLFTEEQFQQFQKEYFGRTVEGGGL